MPFDARSLNLELLRTLLAVGSSRTFGEAAARRGVTTPAVSQQMKTLEAQLGTPLFERVGRRAVLTEKGRQLVDVLRRELAVVEDAVSAVVDDAHATEGVVRIGGPGPFSAMWLRPRVVRLLAAHPKLRLTIEYAVPSALTKRLLDGDLDLCLVVRAVDEPALASEVVYVEQFVPVAAPGYLKEYGRPTDAAGFRRHPFVAYDADLTMLSSWWRATWGPREPLPADVRVAVTSLDDMRFLARVGAGIAVLPDYFVADDLASGALARVCKDRPGHERRKQEARNPISLCWRRAAIETARLRAVREALLRGALAR
jgi:DNA-binding transcriptional LysR family regulator